MNAPMIPAKEREVRAAIMVWFEEALLGLREDMRAYGVPQALIDEAAAMARARQLIQIERDAHHIVRDMAAQEE